MDGGAERADGLLLEDIAGEEEEGRECEDCESVRLGARGEWGSRLEESKTYQRKRI